MAATNLVAYAEDTINRASQSSGADALFINKSFTVTTGAEANSTYRIAQIPAGYVPFLGFITTAGIAGLTDCDLGVYLPAIQGGTVVDLDAFVDGVNLSGAVTIASPSNIFSAMTPTTLESRIHELSAIADGIAEYQTYDLTLTTKAQASATGVINVRAVFVNGM